MSPCMSTHIHSRRASASAVRNPLLERERERKRWLSVAAGRIPPHVLRVLQCVAVCCRVLPCVTVCYSVLQCVAVSCRVLQCVTLCCSVLQCVAVCCCWVYSPSYALLVAVCYSRWASTSAVCNLPPSERERERERERRVGAAAGRILPTHILCCGVLQCVAVCCMVLQCVAACCSVLQCVTICYGVLQCVAERDRSCCCLAYSFYMHLVLQCVAVFL